MFKEVLLETAIIVVSIIVSVVFAHLTKKEVHILIRLKLCTVEIAISATH